MEKICKNCQWYEAKKHQYRAIYGGCKNKYFQYGGRMEDEEYPVEANGLLYWDVDSYGAGFDVGENFGCIHWEEKVK
jgi:hypothetical protein